MPKAIRIAAEIGSPISLSKKALHQQLMNNSLDTSGTHQQTVYHTSLHLAMQLKLALRTSAQRASKHWTSTQRANKHRISIRKITEGTALQPLMAQRPENQQPTRMILALTARKLQQSHLQNAWEKGRGNTPPWQASQKASRGKRHRRCYSSSSSSSFSSFSSSLFSSPETSSRSSSSSSGRYSHQRKHKRHHYRTRIYSLGNYYPGSITCAPPLPWACKITSDEVNL